MISINEFSSILVGKHIFFSTLALLYISLVFAWHPSSQQSFTIYDFGQSKLAFITKRVLQRSKMPKQSKIAVFDKENSIPHLESLLKIKLVWKWKLHSTKSSVFCLPWPSSWWEMWRYCLIIGSLQRIGPKNKTPCLIRAHLVVLKICTQDGMLQNLCDGATL